MPQKKDPELVIKPINPGYEMSELIVIKWYSGCITSSSYHNRLRWHICGFILMILHLHSLSGLSIQRNPSWWTLPRLPINHITVSMDTEHHGLNLSWGAPRRSRVFVFFFHFLSLSSGVTLSSPQAMQKDCFACGKWLANPEQSRSQTARMLLTAILPQSFGDISKDLACFGFCYLVLCVWEYWLGC